MKKIKLVILCLFLFNLTSCEQNEVPLFDTEAKPGLNIWFGGMTGNVFNEITHDFGALLPGPAEILFSVRIIGLPVDYDRVFTLVPTEGDSNKIDFTMGTFTLPARERQYSFSFDIITPENFDGFIEEDGFVQFRMAPNPHFVYGLAERSRLDINLTNSAVDGRPAGWYDSWQNRTTWWWPLANRFGPYSRVKHEFLESVIGPIDFRFFNSNSVTQLNAEPILPPQRIVMMAEARRMQDLAIIALQELNASIAPNYLRDENGVRITIPL